MDIFLNLSWFYTSPDMSNYAWNNGCQFLHYPKRLINLRISSLFIKNHSFVFKTKKFKVKNYINMP